MFNERGVYGAAGVGVALSLAHFFWTRRRVTRHIPLRFDLRGRPGTFVPGTLFWLFPVLVLTESLLLLLVRRFFAERMCRGYVKRVMEVEMREDTLVAYGALVATLAGQYYAGEIGQGAATQMPCAVAPALVALCLMPLSLRLL